MKDKKYIFLVTQEYAGEYDIRGAFTTMDKAVSYIQEQNIQPYSTMSVKRIELI